MCVSMNKLYRQNEERWRSGGEGRLDVNGVRWWACDPYPTWYRWDDRNLHVRGEDGNPAPWAREGPCPVCQDTGLAYDAVEQREVPCGGIGCSVVDQ